MQKTELKIYADSKFYNVDLFDNEPIELTKSIIELTEPEQRKSDYTKTINIPGTANNNSIFSNIFDVNHSIMNGDNANFYIDFNPSKKANCILYREGVPQIRGYLQMTSINILDEQNITYELVVYGRVANLFQDVGDRLISDYDFSEYNHVWNETNVINSINTSIYINGVTAAFQYGRGYVYPLIDYGFDNNKQRTYNVDQLYPAVYVKTILDKILSTHDYRYKSTIQSNTFLNSVEFKRLIILSSGNNLRLTDTQVVNRTFVVTQSIDDNIGNPSTSLVKLMFDTTTRDTTPSGVAVNHSSWIAPSGINGMYKFVANLKLNLDFNLTLGANSFIIFDLNLVIKTTTGVVLNNGSNWHRNLVSSSTNFNLSEVWESNESLMYAGLEIEVYWQIRNPVIYTSGSMSGINSSDITVTILQGTTFYSLPNPNLSEGTDIDVTNCLPELKAKDFLTGLIKMFNLYIEPNQLDDKLLIIEPRDIYYTNDVVDITDNLDVSKDFIQRPMGALDFKKIDFTYVNDDDYYNKDYTDKYNYNYGFKRKEINNDFLVETKKIELPFAPTPLQKPSTTDRIIPQIVWWKDLNTSSNRVNKTAKPRILYYGGLKYTGSGYTIHSNLNNTNTNYTSYGYAGHVDDPINPIYDLNWATTQEIYYQVAGTTPITVNNLYKRYWEKYISEITDKDSKIIDCYMYFNNVELQNLSFKKLYKIDRQYYRLYKVEVDLNSNEPAHCVFLKIKNINVELADQVVVNGGSQTIEGERYTPIINQTKNRIDVLNIKEDYYVKARDFQDLNGYYLEAISQFVLVNTDVYLPEANNGYIDSEKKSLEIRIYNNHSGNIKIHYDDTYISMASHSGATFYSNGVNWFKF